jgi:glycosyltransferase involved in cell wall biosynthesis
MTFLCNYSSNISVIIPTYNSAEFLTSSIESVLRQTFSPLEIIVVNDGSTDNTYNILEPYLTEIRYFSQTNAGPGAARNLGLRHAKGEYIAFLDADDIWLPQKLERQMDLFLKNSNIGMVYSRYVEFFTNGCTNTTTLPKKAYSGKIFERILVGNFICMSTVVVRSRTLNLIGMFDESLITAEDTNLYLRIAKTWQICAIEEVLVNRRKHVDSLSSQTDIPIGTLENLDRIVDLYPETAPEKYPPMKRAYLSRGKGMMLDLFSATEYRTCRKIAIRMLNFSPFDLIAMKYFFLTLFPSRLLNYVRDLKCYLLVKIKG